ncbi:head-tail connector protein [Rickettsiaceae bacterium]|nr:head-tail connector protein [Rickettsiaceae bacterium]
MVKNKRVTYQITNTQIKEILSLEEIKNYLRISHDYDDGLIKSLKESAINHAESFTGLSLHKREIICDVQNSQSSILPKYIHIIEVKKVWLLRKNEKREITDSFGYIATDTQSLHFECDHIGDNITIEYIAGYQDSIPRTVQHGILMHVASMYEHAEDGASMSDKIRDLYLPYRVMKI